MEENKQITENKITYEEVFKAVERLPEEEKAMILSCLNIEDIRYILDSKENTEKYSKQLTETATFYVTMTNIILELFNYVNNPKSEADAIMEKYSGLDEAEKKNFALNMLGQKEFLKDGREILQEEFDKWEKMNPRTKILSKSLMEFIESIFSLRKYNHVVTKNE